MSLHLTWVSIPIFIIVLLSHPWAQADYVWQSEKVGYLKEVTNERYEKISDLLVVDEPPRLASQVSRPIFTESLSKEIKNQYTLRFGETDVERNYHAMNRFSFFQLPGGEQETAEVYQNRQQAFGEYVLRRVTEYHVDQIFRNDPKLKPVYELKEKIQNVNLEVKKNYKLKIKYSFSGQYLEFKMDNPYEIQNRLHLEMGGHQPGQIFDRAIYNMSYSFQKRLWASLSQEFDMSTGSILSFSYRWTRQMSLTLSGTYNTIVNRDEWRSSPRHNLVLFGWTWNE